jgi:hypothetical protein
MANWPTMPEVRTYLRLQPDATQDGIITTSLAAAVDYANRRLNYKYPIPPADDGTLPDLAHDAVVKHAARLFKRRDSVDGTLGLGDQGVIRVGRFDADIDAAYNACGPLVFG